MPLKRPKQCWGHDLSVYAGQRQQVSLCFLEDAVRVSGCNISNRKESSAVFNFSWLTHTINTSREPVAFHCLNSTQVNAWRHDVLNVQPTQVSHKCLCVPRNMEGRQENDVSMMTVAANKPQRTQLWGVVCFCTSCIILLRLGAFFAHCCNSIHIASCWWILWTCWSVLFSMVRFV